MRVQPVVVVGVAVGLMALGSVSKGGEPTTVVLRPDRVLDGRGEVTRDTEVVVREGRIVEVRSVGAEPIPGAAVYELPGRTLMPGLIDTHVHIGWHFDEDGRSHGPESTDTVEQQMLFAAENAYRTLLGGVTTVQSIGAELDVDLRDAIARGVLLGPRILTSIRSVHEGIGGPEEIRRFVAEVAEDGGDVIKIFGSASIRVGGTPTMSQEQLDAACGEAAERGLRAVVHAHGPESARRSVLAGCTTIEHGALLDRATLELMAERGVFYDPNIDLILRNYFENKERFLGIGNYTEEGFAQMRAAVPKALETFKVALEVSGLGIVFGTDSLAGSHGRNVQELVYRIETGGQPVMDAVVSATSLAAESLGLAESVGSIFPGYEADVIAVEGNPLEDPGALERVVFVMKGGRVISSPPQPAD